jgi:hypothetical protein
MWTEISDVTVNSPTTIVDFFNPNGDGKAVWHLFLMKSNALTEYTVNAAWDDSAGTVSFRSEKSVDLGDPTADIVFSVTMTAALGNVQLLATAATSGWTASGIRYATGVDGSGGGVGGIPLGGDAGQVLAKKTAADLDTEWVDQSGGSGVDLPTNLIPQMTSNTDPSGVASEGSAYNAGTMAWAAMNQTSAGWLTANSNPTDAWIKYDFGAATVVNSYSFAPWSIDNYGLRSPTGWTFDGSNDGTNWTALDTVTDMSGVTRGTVGNYYQVYRGIWAQVCFNLDSEANYRYYRFKVNTYQGGGYIGLADFRIHATRISFVV